MDKVIIKNLLVRGIIGINDWEREKIQDILINVVMFGDLQKAGKTDDIEDCVNYRTVSKKIFAHKAFYSRSIGSRYRPNLPGRNRGNEGYRPGRKTWGSSLRRIGWSRD